nr:hypothetical protein [uncultured Ottowia sp.]
MRQNLLTLLGINVAAIQIAEGGRALTTDVALMDMALTPFFWSWAL